MMRLLVAVCISAAGQSSLRPPIQPAFARRLFNGQNLDGWHVTGCDVGVENGLLVTKEGNGFVRTDSRYRDFVLELDYRAAASGNVRRGHLHPLRAARRGQAVAEPVSDQPEARRRAEPDQVSQGPQHGTGEAGRVEPHQADRRRRQGRDGNQRPARLGNGRPGSEATATSASRSKCPAAGSSSSRTSPSPSSATKPLFDGQSLAGWEGAGQPAENAGRSTDGTIVCTGEKGPWLRSKEQYGDFNLRLEYKLKAGGNSGVYIRVPENGNHHGDGAGIEVQVLDDKAERYKQRSSPINTRAASTRSPRRRSTSAARPASGTRWRSTAAARSTTSFTTASTIVAADESTYPGAEGPADQGLPRPAEPQRGSLVPQPADRPGATTCPCRRRPRRDARRSSSPRAPGSKPILEPRTPQREVEAFCEARVVPSARRRMRPSGNRPKPG